ncbi:hypothetical protein QSV08_06125 [Maribacter sp. BPC-D8]|uniref:hypothetical protein n=1 Tax=Maribacter sp. BPC-D8 TaxID=3053613 RepID=UPI002B46391D|nr:hypothetical protein [Maribacter sp. BPC-D8]WRI30820.1 hypothetical protein QSV08_06125 [Maribacter sp. BPC-D8]
MENIIQLNPSLGKIEYKAGDSSDFFEISESELCVEKINGQSLLYISAIASHHEIHGEHKVYIPDLSFSLIMPLEKNELANKSVIKFPEADTNHQDWEKYVYSSFYQFEHLLILNCSFQIERKNGLYNIIVKGEVRRGIESNYGYQFDAEFHAELKNKIDRNKYFFLAE